MKKWMLCLLLAAGSMLQLAAQDLSLYQQKWFIRGTDTLPYRLLLPENYDSTKQYPVILFLHGAGERGRDNERQLTHGGKLFLQDDVRKKYPAIVVFPQCSFTSFWSNVQFKLDTTSKKRIGFDFQESGEPTSAMKLAMGMFEGILKDYPVKTDQVYVMGLSMGGMGTFEIVRRMPNTFAAAIPICGGANPNTAKELRKTAWYIIHGAKDDVVPPKYSEDMVVALRKFYGVEMEYLVFPNANHNSWDPAFAEPGLLPWLFKQRKTN